MSKQKIVEEIERRIYKLNCNKFSKDEEVLQSLSELLVFITSLPEEHKEGKSAEEFLESKGISLHSVNAVRFPSDNNMEFKIIDLMTEFASQSKPKLTDGMIEDIAYKELPIPKLIPNTPDYTIQKRYAFMNGMKQARTYYENK